MRNLERIGLWLFAAGTLGLGVVGLAFGAFLPGLQPAPPSWSLGGAGPLAAGLILLLGGAGLLHRATARGAGRALAAFWAAWLLVAHLPALAAAPGLITAWVSAAQVLVLSIVALALAEPPHGRGGTVRRAAGLAAGAMLVLFGAVHLMHVQAIAGLLPEGFPGRAWWPWATGAGQVVAGLALISGVRARQAAAVVAAMFLSWIPLAHLPRVAGAPDSVFEWGFMVGAVALAGAVLVGGTLRDGRS